MSKPAAWLSLMGKQPMQKAGNKSFKARKRTQAFENAIKDFRASELYGELSRNHDAETMAAIEGYIVFFKSTDPHTVKVAAKYAELRMKEDIFLIETANKLSMPLLSLRIEARLYKEEHGETESMMNAFKPPKPLTNKWPGKDILRILELEGWMGKRGGATDPVRAWRGAFVRKMGELLPEEYATITKLARFAGMKMTQQNVRSIYLRGQT